MFMGLAPGLSHGTKKGALRSLSYSFLVGTTSQQNSHLACEPLSRFQAINYETNSVKLWPFELFGKFFNLVHQLLLLLLRTIPLQVLWVLVVQPGRDGQVVVEPPGSSDAKASRRARRKWRPQLLDFVKSVQENWDLPQKFLLELVKKYFWSESVQSFPPLIKSGCRLLKLEQTKIMSWLDLAWVNLIRFLQSLCTYFMDLLWQLQAPVEIWAAFIIASCIFRQN